MKTSRKLIFFSLFVFISIQSNHVQAQSGLDILIKYLNLTTSTAAPVVTTTQQLTTTLNIFDRIAQWLAQFGVSTQSTTTTTTTTTTTPIPTTISDGSTTKMSFADLMKRIRDLLNKFQTTTQASSSQPTSPQTDASSPVTEASSSISTGVVTSPQTDASSPSTDLPSSPKTDASSPSTEALTSPQTEAASSILTDAVTSPQTEVSSPSTDLPTSPQTEAFSSPQTDASSPSTVAVTSSQTEVASSISTDAVSSPSTDLPSSPQTEATPPAPTEPPTPTPTQSSGPQTSEATTEAITEGSTAASSVDSSPQTSSIPPIDPDVTSPSILPTDITTPSSADACIQLADLLYHIQKARISLEAFVKRNEDTAAELERRAALIADKIIQEPDEYQKAYLTLLSDGYKNLAAKLRGENPKVETLIGLDKALEGQIQTAFDTKCPGVSPKPLYTVPALNIDCVTLLDSIALGSQDAGSMIAMGTKGLEGYKKGFEDLLGSLFGAVSDAFTGVTLPEGTLPEVTVPEFTLPEATLPEVTVPEIPTLPTPFGGLFA